MIFTDYSASESSKRWARLFFQNGAFILCMAEFRRGAGRVPPQTGSIDPAADVLTSLPLKMYLYDALHVTEK